MLDVRPQIGDLVHDPHEVLFAERIVVRPRNLLPDERQSPVRIGAART